MTRIGLLMLFLALVPFWGKAESRVAVASPDGNVRFELELKQGEAFYRVSCGSRRLIDDSAIGFVFDSGEFGKNLRLGKTVRSKKEETYDLTVGKTKTVHSLSNEAVIPLMETAAPGRRIDLVVRVFDDGIGFRYEFPRQDGWKSYVMEEERTTFNIAGNPKVLTMYLDSYRTSHEGEYDYTDYAALEEKHLMEMPTLLEYPGGVCMALTEAAVRDYAGMYLWKEDGTLRGKLSPDLKDERIKVRAGLPHRSPWRVLMIGDRPGDLIESNLLTNLNEPCRIADTSWIRPGKTTFSWWNDNVVPDTAFQAGNNFLTNKYYIDFCARNGIAYHGVYGYGEKPWYEDNGAWFGAPGEYHDITKPVATLDMKQVCDYAESQGVGIYVWTNWLPLYEKIDEAFDLFEQWGVKGMMIDFMDRDDQEMIRIQEEFLEKAAEHRLFVQFHGSCKPSGLHRTYPNEFTREGTLNYETFKFRMVTTADHDISIPFTRMLAGATDYHLGGFRALRRDNFKPQNRNPYVTSSRCHMLAMYVVLESYLAMVCDTPMAYEGQPGFEFIREVPTVWDETKVIAADVNEYIAVARRKGSDWYVGVIGNGKPRTVALPLGFLGEGGYGLTLYRDAADTPTDPNQLVKEERETTARETLSVALSADGGAAMVLKKL